MGIFVELGKSFAFLGKMVTAEEHDVEEIDYDIEKIESDRTITDGLRAGEEAADKTAEKTVDYTKNTFGMDMENSTIDEHISKKENNSSSNKSGKTKKIRNTLEENGIIGDNVRINNESGIVKDRPKGGEERNKN